MATGKVYIEPPKASKRLARMGLDARAAAPKSKKGGLTTQQAGKEGVGSGVARARDILSGKRVQARQVKAFFDRHQGNYQEAVKRIQRSPLKLVQAATQEPVIQSWWMWGGDPMRAAAEKALKENPALVPDASGFTPGDALVRKWNVRGLPGYHYGIYMGDFLVAHADHPIGQVVVMDLEGFSCSKETYCDSSILMEPQNRQETLDRAYEAVGLPYKLFQHNCEHFASWCVTGNPHSLQMHTWIRRSLLAVGAAVIIVNPGQPKEAQVLHEGQEIFVQLPEGEFLAIVSTDALEGVDEIVEVQLADFSDRGYVQWSEIRRLHAASPRSLKARLLK